MRTYVPPKDYDEHPQEYYRQDTKNHSAFHVAPLDLFVSPKKQFKNSFYALLPKLQDSSCRTRNSLDYRGGAFI
jgi:hypothetical protein